MKSKRKNKFRHNKKRNTVFLFEVLVKELTKASLQKNEGKKTKVVSILKKHFAKGTALNRELDIYRALLETRSVSIPTAERMLKEAKIAHAAIPPRVIFAGQSGLISDMTQELGTGVYSNFVPNYKDLATLAQIFNDSAPLASRVLMEQKQVELMTTENEAEGSGMNHVSNLTYRTFTKRFNKEYSGKLHEEQATLLNKFIYSFADDGLSLKVFLNEEIGRLKSAVVSSFDTPEIKEDSNMLANARNVLAILESFKDSPITEIEVKKILKIQELAREVSE